MEMINRKNQEIIFITRVFVINDIKMSRENFFFIFMYIKNQTMLY